MRIKQYKERDEHETILGSSEDGILHVRSAGLIMKEASQFASDVKVTKDEKTVNGKDILEWMGLKLVVGDVITVNIEGPDEEAAADSFEVFLNRQFS